LVYISLSLGLMMDLYSKDIYYDVISSRYDNDGFWIPLWIIASIWINDTMAYIVVQSLENTFIKISPRKHGKAL